MGGQLCGSSRPTLKDVLACVCACVTHATLFPFVMALNTLFEDWQTTFHTDRGTTASVQAVCMGITNGGGIVAGILERKLGQRMSMLLGIFLSTLGFFAGGFANSIPVLVLCVGVVVGFGFSITYIANMSRALQRFPNRAGFVSSLMVLISGTGMLGSPFLFRYFTETYNWRGCLFLVAGLIFQAFPSCLLCSSPLLRPSKKDMTKGGEGEVEGENPKEAMLLQKEETSAGGESLAESAGGEGRTCFLLRHAPFLTSPLYLCITLSVNLNMTMIGAFVFLVLDFAKTLDGCTLADGLFLNTVFMACNLASRALIMLMSLHPRFNSIVCLGVVGLIGGLAMCLVGQVSSYALVAVVFAVMAVCFGGSMNMFPASILKATGNKDFSLGLGVGSTLMGISSIAFTAMAGFLVDKQGSYSLASLIYGFSILSASALLLVVFKCCKPAAAVSVDR